MLAESARSGFLNQSPSRRVLVTKHLRIVVTKSENGSYQIGESQFPKHSIKSEILSYQIAEIWFPNRRFIVPISQFPNRGNVVTEAEIVSYPTVVPKSQFPNRSFQIAHSYPIGLPSSRCGPMSRSVSKQFFAKKQLSNRFFYMHSKHILLTK